MDKFHRRGIYVIARIVVLQDSVLAKARPDLAIHNKKKISLLKKPSSSLSSSLPLSSFSLWVDNLRLNWIDPSSKEAWRYNVFIAKNAFSHGFDEVNFDYIRFPSDGNLQNMDFPFWDGKTPKRAVVKNFFKYIRKELPDEIISIDLFGLSTISTDDLGIGQVIEDARGYFNYICPMVYPSHYDPGFMGYEEPARHPYEIVKRSIESAQKRLASSDESRCEGARLRPWLQDFDLRKVPYGSKEVKAEIKGVRDTSNNRFDGFMLWSPWNIYTKDALRAGSLSKFQLY